ncbi:RlpA-like double-psi beta-barrel-protein domain-containing protein-containing protein [Boletus edulis BED1]|uniref:RlpA-like double-psi beta-barrel-protein domain-containing protein-containing protein n=1 Tax=Boletus edulis BED1 TaxID=1328754 RepID=A0AAD4C1G3_BOLED|nr:RlpA-like double-psi beta-barrel-protein domain-containing protein-containing protein [Boletus edulis BED1]
MRSFRLLSLVLPVFLLSCSPVQAEHSYGPEKPRAPHRHINKLTLDAKYKRDANAAFTYFDVGQGACGATNTASDFIVALNSAEYGSGAHCFEMITITINGKTAQAQITDECPGCSVGGLDFSQGLFQYFAPVSVGELYGSWSYNRDIATSSSTFTPSSTSYTPSTTTTSSSTALSTTTTTTSLASTNVPSPTSTTSTTSTVPTSTPQDPQILTQINLALLELGALLQVSL